MTGFLPFVLLLAITGVAVGQTCDGIYADTLAHPADCKFYYNLYLMTCPEGQLYNSQTRRCGPAEESQCGQTTSNTIPTEQPSTSEWPSTTMDGSTTSTTASTSAQTTTSSGSTTTSSGSTTTSSGSTTTSSGSTTTSSGSTTTSSGTDTTATGTTTTSSGTDTTTTGATTTTGSGSTTTSGTTSDSSSTGTAETTTGVPTEGSTTPKPSRYECPAVDDPNVKIRYPHDTDCELYYLCVSGTATLYKCTSGSHFSPTRRSCRPMEEAGCDRCPPTEVARLPHESVCAYYYKCEEGTSSLYACPEPLQFSRWERLCVDAEEAYCTLEDGLSTSAAPLK